MLGELVRTRSILLFMDGMNRGQLALSFGFARDLCERRRVPSAAPRDGAPSLVHFPSRWRSWSATNVTVRRCCCRQPPLRRCRGDYSRAIAIRSVASSPGVRGSVAAAGAAARRAVRYVGAPSNSASHCAECRHSARLCAAPQPSRCCGVSQLRQVHSLQHLPRIPHASNEIQLRCGKMVL